MLYRLLERTDYPPTHADDYKCMWISFSLNGRKGRTERFSEGRSNRRGHSHEEIICWVSANYVRFSNVAPTNGIFPGEIKILPIGQESTIHRDLRMSNFEIADCWPFFKNPIPNLFLHSRRTLINGLLINVNSVSRTIDMIDNIRTVWYMRNAESTSFPSSYFTWHICVIVLT